MYFHRAQKVGQKIKVKWDVFPLNFPYSASLNKTFLLVLDYFISLGFLLLLHTKHKKYIFKEGISFESKTTVNRKGDRKSERQKNTSNSIFSAYGNE